jgi:hypothetical protein
LLFEYNMYVILLKMLGLKCSRALKLYLDELHVNIAIAPSLIEEEKYRVHC